MKLLSTKKVELAKREVRGFLASLDDPFTTTRRTLLLGGAVALLGGIVIGFLCAPDRTRNITFGSNNTNNGSNNGGLPADSGDGENVDEDDED